MAPSSPSLSHSSPSLLLSLCVVLLLSSQVSCQGVLVGSGAFPFILVQNLLLTFYSVDDNAIFNYKEEPFPVSSDKFIHNQIDFLLSQQIIPLANHTISECCNCDDIRALPIAVSGLALIHSVGGWGDSSAPSITLTRSQLVDIYLGTSDTWNDIDGSLPNTAIRVAHQTCSGPDIFTVGLASMSSSWTQICPTATFPVGQGFETEQGILDYVKNNPNSIGYVSYAFLASSQSTNINPMQLVSLVNRGGTTVKPTLNSFTAAALSVSLTNDELGLSANLVDTTGTSAWPLSSYEYVTLRSKNNNCGKLNGLFRFFSWILSAREIRHATLTPYGVADIPDSLMGQVQGLLNSFSCCTKVNPTILISHSTPFGDSSYQDLAFTYFSGTQQLVDTVTSSTEALDKLEAGQIDAALSSIYPTTSTADLLPIRLFASGAVCIANIQGFTSEDNVVLTRNTLAAIFDQTITSWNDAAITAQNAAYATNLQATGNIAPQVFADEDTRMVIARALAKFSSTFNDGAMPNAGSGVTTADVIASVEATLGAIGCVRYSADMVLSGKSTVVGLINAAGTTITAPSAVNFYAAAVDFATSPPETLLVDGGGVNSWPICAYSYLVLNNNGRCTPLSAFAQFAVWIFSSESAQHYIAEDAVIPPSSVTFAEQQILLDVTCGGNPLTPDTKKVFGAGATFPLLIYQSWPIQFSTFPDPATRNSSVNVLVSYSTGGSVSGEAEVKAGSVHFGTSELPNEENDAANGLVRFPMLAGAVALVYNLGQSIPSLVLNRELLVQIYSGTVNTWNDARIATLNPSVTLPARPINLVYRSETCGSTYILKKALQSFATPTTPWTGDTLPNNTWPVTSSFIGEESYDVAVMVETHPFTLGYAEASYANFTSLPCVTIINKAGNPTLPTPLSVASAMNDFPLSNTSLVRDIVDGPGANSYPLASYTFALTRKNWTEPTQCNAATRTLSFLHWGMSESAAHTRVRGLGFVPLPPSSIFLVEDVMRQVNCSMKPVLPSIARGCDGVIGSGVQNDACGECGGDNSTCCLGTFDQIKEYCFKCAYAPGEDHVLKTYECDGFLDCDGGEDDLHCTVSLLKTSVALSAVAGLCIFLCFVVGVDVFLNRNERIFRESNVFFMMMILSGCIIGFSAVFVLSQLSKLNNFVCGTQYWFFGIAFVLTFNAMIAKTYQVYMLHRQHSGDLSAYTNQAIVRYVAAAMGVVFVILIIWTAFDRPVPVLRYNDPSDEDKRHYICGNKHFTIFAILLALYFAIILVTGVVLSFLSRDIDFEGNESRLIRKTILSAALLACVILPILIALGSSFPFVRILLTNVAILLLASLVMFTYFGPKLYQFHLGEQWTPDSSSGKSGGGYRHMGPIDI